MPEIAYSNFISYLEKTPVAELARFWLIHGEEALCKRAAGALVDRLLPGAEKNLGYDPVDNDDVFAAIERASTFSLFAGTRVIAMTDSRIFYTRDDHQSLFKKAREAAGAGALARAARHFTAALGLLDLSLADAAQLADERGEAKIAPEVWGDGRWADAVLAYCREKGLSPAPAADRSAELQQAVSGGFPAGNYLLITTDLVDKRRALYKTLLKEGAVVNCAVPMGSGRKDVMAREALMAEHARELLARHRKRMEPAAWRRMSEMTGFDLRILSDNLEKLIQYTGDAPAITAADVDAVLKRTRQDPVWALTGAVSERNLQDALFYLDSLLGEGLAPLQILAAATNAMRRLLLAKGFIVGPGGRAWQSGMRYNDFQQSVMPAIQAHDETLLSTVSEWDAPASGSGDNAAGAKAGKKSARPSTDLVLAPKGRSAYPIYLLLKNSERFRLRELIDILADLQRTDVGLKTSGGPPRELLEAVIIRICRGSGHPSPRY